MNTLTRIYKLLMRRPKSGVMNWELAGITLRYGARINDLRKSGYNIKTFRLKDGDYQYILFR